MVISNSKHDNRLTKLFTANKEYFLTESTAKEVATLLGKDNYRKILSAPTKTIGFEDLRDITPEACPLYYNFISYMNSPAIVLDPHFSASQMTDILLKKKQLSTEEIRVKNSIIDDLIKFEREEEEKLEKEGLSRVAAFDGKKFYKKKRDVLKNSDHNYLNDMRNVSLTLLYCLIHRKNVVLVTADNDYTRHFFDLTNAIADHLTLKISVLLELEEKKKKNLPKKSFTFFVKPVEHAKKRMQMLSDFYSNHWKKGFVFKIKIWNQQSQKYEELYITFSEVTRELFLNATGNFKCPYAQNITMGSWLNIKYFWPPEDGNFEKMQVSVSKENMIVYKNKCTPRETHEASCLYSLKDRENDYAFFSCFIKTE